MSRKEKVTLGNISNIITGPFGSQLHQSDYVPVGIACIMPQNIGNRTLNKDGIARISKKDAERLSRYVVRVDDIVYARRGDVEKHAYISSEDDGALCGTGCMRVRVDSEKAYPLYVSFYLNRTESKRWISQHAVGSNMPNLNTEILNNVPIELPAMAEQKIISHFLENIDRKIQLNVQICAELEAMAKTLYNYWFMQFDFPDENGKPYRTSGGEMVWNEQLKREIPKGWDVKHLQDICRFRNGINYEKDCLGDCTYRIANVRNITASSFLMDVSDFDEITLPKNQGDKYILSENDIIIARSGTPGATRLVIKPSNNVIFCGFIICCTPFNSQFRLFLSYFLKQLEGTNATKTGGSILQNVSQDTLKSLHVTLPNDSVLNRFNQKIEPLVQMMQNIINENHELAKLRDWFLPMLMNGQARVE
jgi:type I restriction enzyme S subunit